MINISKQIHAGWDNTQLIHAEQVIYEAEIIPDGQSSKELKKLAKFTNDYKIVITVDNVPLPGFTLYNVGKKRYSSPDSSWLVIDPRGFMARITNKNMLSILQVSGITEGLIQQKCVWARQDSNTELTLVPMSSSAYNVAVGNTELLDAKVDIKDVCIGDTVLLQNGLQGKYMGVLSLYSKMEKSYQNVYRAPAHLRKQIVEILPGKFHYNTDVKILKIVSKASKPSTREESATYINGCIENNPDCYFSQEAKFLVTPQLSYKHVACASAYAQPKVKISIEEITRQEAEVLFYKGRLALDSSSLLLEYPTDKQCLVDYPWWGRNKQVEIDGFAVQDIIEIDDNKIVVQGKQTATYLPMPAQDTLYSFDNFKKFYKIVKQVKTLTYI